LIVVDTSAVLHALIGLQDHESLVDRLANASRIHAPHLIDVEFLNALRKLVRSGRMDLHRAGDVRQEFGDLAILRCPHEPLVDRAWQLRDNLSAYDAMFVALAELLDAPLVTSDRALSRAPGTDVRFELFGPGRSRGQPKRKPRTR